LALLSVLTMSLPAGALAAAAADVPRYGVFEITLTASGTYSNPYLLMPGDNATPGFVVGTFAGPGSESITMDGFWDGGSTWKIRMSPTSQGVWTYATTSADPGLDGKTGSFTCTSSASRGFIRVDPTHPHHFRWSDGTPFYWAPVTTMIAHFDDRDAQGGTRRVDNGAFQSLADVRAAQGFTATHWGYYGFNKPQFNDDSQANEGGPPFTNYNPDLLNASYYQFGDRRVTALLDRGIIPQFTLGWPDQGIASLGHERLKRCWRYLIARYAAYNVTWNLFGEGDEFGSSWLSVANDYGDLTKRRDPYDHVTTTHLTGGPTSTLAGQSWYDYIMLQRGASATSDYLSYGKPVVNAEYGGYEDQDVSGDQLRALVWGVRMHGGYFVYESWGDDPESSGANYAGIANRFFRDRTRFELLEYHPELMGGTPALANPGQEYVVYLQSGGSVTADLSAASGTLPVEWYNPRTGTAAAAPTTSGGASRAFSAPDSNDWVLHIGGASSDSIPPGAPSNLIAR
jgi:hypothetical protein